MAVVRLSSLRFRSMLNNRAFTLERFIEGLDSDVDLSPLLRTDRDVEFDDLVAIAKRFKRPWTYLLIDEVETISTGRHDNRTLLNQHVPLSAELLDQLVAANSMLEAAQELFPDVVVQLPGIPRDIEPSALEIGGIIRAHLGVTDSDQLATQGDYAALRLWSDAVQASGAYVSTRRLDDATVRAFSLASNGYAVIVLDTLDTAYARIFSLIHEYAHVLLNSTGLCDLDDHGQLERFCNAVAASTLMPGPLVRAHLHTHEWGASADSDEAVARRLSSRIGVSQAAMLIRLRDLGVLDQASYEELERRRSERPPPDTTSGGTYYRTAVSRVGRRWARNVVDAYHDGQIDRLDASALLEIPAHNLTGFEQELSGGGTRR